MITLEGAPSVYRDTVQWALDEAGFTRVHVEDVESKFILIRNAEAPPSRATIALILPGADPKRPPKERDATWLTASDWEAGLFAKATVQKPRAISSIRWTSQEPIRRAPDGDEGLLVRPESFDEVLRALHRGVPIVVPTTSPLAPYVDHDINGLVVPDDELDDAAFSLKTKQSRKLRALTVAHPGRMRMYQQAFIEAFRTRVGGRPRRVIFAHGRHHQIDPRTAASGTQKARGVRFQALVGRGFSVLHVPELSELSETPHDFVFLGGRVPAERVRAVSEATFRPIVLAMNDAILEMPERLEWLKEIGDHIDLVFTGEPPEGLPEIESRLVQLHQPPLNLATAQRSTRRMPYTPLRVDPALGVVFPANHWYLRRTELIRAIAVQAPVHVVGKNDPRIPGVRRSPKLAGVEYMETMRRAVGVLSSSICNDREITSCRLFEAAGVGAYVIAESFPGCRDIYADDCVAWFDTPEAGAALINEALEDPKSAKIMEMRQRAQEYTWRHYSADDRMDTMLRAIEEELKVW